jgi:hypothetical protein
MNVLKKVKIIIILTLPLVLQSMDQKWHETLNPIELQLVWREIENRGKKSVLNDICKDRKDEWLYYDKNYGLCYIGKPVVLKIINFFYPDQINKDLLTKNIFKKIKDIEANSGYHPDFWEVQKTGFAQIMNATNYLGESTRYEHVRVMNNEAVRVWSCFTEAEKEPLLEIVESYDVGCEEKLSS